MVLAGTRRALPRFENNVIFAVPNVARKASVPRADATGSHRISEPPLNKVPTVHQLARTQAGGGSAAARHPGKSQGILMVGTPDVPTRFGYLCQVGAVRRGCPGRC